MATRLTRLPILVILLLFGLCLALGAEDMAKEAVLADQAATDTESTADTESTPENPDMQEDSDFWFEEVEGDVVFTQMLRWDPVPYCPFYDVVVQRQNDRGWETVIENRTEQSELEVQLTAGEYRYRLVVYNLLDKPAVISEWFPFTILRAIQPRVGGVSPDVVYFDEENTDLFSVSGRNLLAESVYRFRSIESPGRFYTGRLGEVDDDERNAEVVFSLDDIEVGLYELEVENPGGLTHAAGPVKFAFFKLMDFDVSAGYMPLFVLWDDTIGHYFDSSAFPLGAVVKATFIPLKRKYGYFGVGLYVAGSMLSNETEFYTLSTNWLMAHCVFVFQKVLIKQRLVLDLHAGPGMTMFHDMHFEFDNGYTTPSTSPWSISALAGASLQVYVLKRLYIEGSADCSMAFMDDMRTLSVHPSLSAGWQF